MQKLRALRYLFLLSILGFVSFNSKAQISITTFGTPVTENFDGMGNSATATLPTGFKIGTDWAVGTTATTLAGGTTGTGVLGGSSSGGVYNFANGVTASSTDRALGFLNSGSFTSPRSIVLRITNNTGGTIGSLSITFDYEKYRSGSRQYDWTFFHGGTSSPSTSATSGDQSNAADANNTTVFNPPTTTGKTVTLTGLTIANGADYYLRWTFTGLGGSTNGQAIGIDNFSITAAAAISTNANLSNLTLSSGTLVPAFASGTTSYTASVTNAISSITVTPTTADAGATVKVNGNTVVSGNPSGSIALNVGSNIITTEVTAQDAVTIKTYTVDVTRAAAGVPTITLTSALPDFGNVCINTSAGPNSFTIDGTDLDGSNSISIAALTGFTYSENSGGPFTGTLNFSYSGGGFSNKLIYVMFNPTLVQSYNGNINLSGGGVGSFNVAATGSGVNTGPTVVSAAPTNVGSTSATANGTISAVGCSPVTAYGIEYSINNGFPDGTGTQVASGNLSAGNFSSNLTGLSANTRYYYKAYATNGTVTAYGTQQAFTLGALPVDMSAQSGFSYTEDFSDIANWTNFFIAGTGANHWSGLSTNAGAIPNPQTLTTSTQSFSSGTSGGVQKGTGNIVLLATGATDNTSSAAIDFYMDFTGLNAGTLSFDWAVVNNSTGDRKSSLRVYTSTDGTTWTELTFADVLNFANNPPTPVSGSQSNIALPASFNNSATARLRFYYHNGSGGTTGSRPKISIDNLNITAVATTPCVSPSAPATALTFGTITDNSIAGSFTAASPASDGYLVVMSTSNSLTANPIDGQIYNLGDNVGDGSVIAKGSSTSFTATGLTGLTTYYFFIFTMNSICTGGPLYYSTTVLNGSATTIAGLPNCTAPTSQPTNLVFGSTTFNSIDGSFTATTADGYLVVRSTSSTLSNNPVDGQSYNSGDVLGNGVVVQQNNSTSFSAGSLSSSTLYYFFVFALNSQNCVNGPAYNITSPLTNSQTTLSLPACTTPSAQPSALTFNASNRAISGAFVSGMNADAYLTVMSTTSSLSSPPVDNIDYNPGDALGGGTVVSVSPNNSFLQTSLAANTQYYFFVYAANTNCSGGTKYLTSSSALSGTKTTTNDPVLNYYFGSLHSHSDYSDGNQDHPGFTPTDDYTYAKTALCMDYLGISEHNHFSNVNNPGNTITNYHSGPVEADNFTTSNPGFLALYGMEWGVISGGGHVVVYGDGMNTLWGWETGAGGWGATDNYDVYVPKSVYTGPTGLFKTVNDNIATNTFATLAHPDNTDYNNVLNGAYDVVADNAIVGTAVESGPATSTNTTYTNPGSSLFYLSYYRNMLSKGYHLGPTIDHDNHNTTFGHTTRSRTAIVSPSLTKTDIISGMRNMHFYATQDCDTKIDFTINTQLMGSIMTDRFGPEIYVSLSDVTSNVNTAVIRVMFGVPGSGVTATKIDEVTGSTLKFVDNGLADLATGYYYIDVIIGTARVITAPIWYTRNDVNGVLPVTLGSFTAQKLNTSTVLKWTTIQEINTRSFVIERSGAGSGWQPIATVPANGNSATPLNYSFIDASPVKGTNLYRLKIVDIDNKFNYSAVRRVNFDNKYTYTIYPNPVDKILQINVDNIAGFSGTLELMNAQSQVLITKKMTGGSQLKLDLSSLASGFYYLRITAADGNVTVHKFIKQ